MKQLRDRSNEQNDATLVTRVLAGEREAFDILLQRHASSVQRLCTTLLGNSVEAQDIAQEAALQAFLGLSRLRDPARFAAWFHAIAANLARSALRRRSERSLETLSEERMTHLLWIDTAPTMEEYQMEREIHEAILLAVQALSPANRQAVLGFYLQGYRYEELAHFLGVPVSTVKWRLFQGRQQLKTLLRPLAESLLYPIESKRRKEEKMKTEDLVALHFDSLRRLLFTRQHLVILCDSDSSRGLPVSLTESKFNALEVAFRARQYAHELSLPQDLSQRLLESFEAHLERVVINALAGQTLYATATIRQGAHIREVDMRLSEALVLAVRMDVPISILRSLFETAATLDLTTEVSPSSEEELLRRGKAMPHRGREERLHWEEAVRNTIATYQHRRPQEFSHRLWTMLLVNLTGSLNAISAAELRALDLATTFPTRDVTWDEQPMVAIRLPDQRETAWVLVPPSIWEKITRQLQGLREPRRRQERAPLAAPPVPEVLSPQHQQQVEESLARLVELPEVRTALLLSPASRVSAWKGPDTQNILQRYCDGRNDLSGHTSLANEQELRRQLGHQWQDISAVPYVEKKALEQERPANIGVGRLLVMDPSGWRLVIFFEEKRTEDVMEKTHQRIHFVWKELRDVLTQRVLD
jgi:RNA polymerase sigma factor (sigma-70 family)